MASNDLFTHIINTQFDINAHQKALGSFPIGNVNANLTLTSYSVPIENSVNYISVHGLVLNVIDGNNFVTLTLNKNAGYANHTVSATLIRDLQLRSVGDVATLKFTNVNPINGNGSVIISSDDTSILTSSLTLFSLFYPSGVVYVNVQAVNVAPGAESVSLTAYHVTYI